MISGRVDQMNHTRGNLSYASGASGVTLTRGIIVNSQTRSEYAYAAAKWWADRLRDGSGIGNNGSNDLNSIAAGGMMELIRSRHPPTEKNCASFEHELTRAIDTLINRDDPECWRDTSGFDDGGQCVVFRVDYHPDDILYGALIESGIHDSVARTSALPLKTNMRVSARRVLVAHGHANPWRELWGPAWGCSFAEQKSADEYRAKEAEIEQNAWMECAIGSRWKSHEWQGCVP